MSGMQALLDDAVNNAAKQRANMVAGAHLYALADRSDPFTFARCMTHINNRVCTPEVTAKDGKQDIYMAEGFNETRSYEHQGKKVEFSVRAYKNIRRP